MAGPVNAVILALQPAINQAINNALGPALAQALPGALNNPVNNAINAAVPPAVQNAVGPAVAAAIQPLEVSLRLITAKVGALMARHHNELVDRTNDMNATIQGIPKMVNLRLVVLQPCHLLDGEYIGGWFWLRSRHGEDASRNTDARCYKHRRELD
jgi:hypothetical protein